MAKKKKTEEVEIKSPGLRKTPMENPLNDGSMSAQVRFDDDNVLYLNYNLTNDKFTLKNLPKGLEFTSSMSTGRYFMPYVTFTVTVDENATITGDTEFLKTCFIRYTLDASAASYVMATENLYTIPAGAGSGETVTFDSAVLVVKSGSNYKAQMANLPLGNLEAMGLRVVLGEDSYNCELQSSGALKVLDPTHTAICNLIVEPIPEP